MDRTDDALFTLETARRLNYATPDMLATLGDLYVNRDQPEEAAARYAAAFAGKSPPVGRLLRAAESFLLNDEPGHAESLMKVVKRQEEAGLSLARDEVRLCRRLEAEMARRKGDLDCARTLYETILADDPLDGEALLQLGDLHRLEGRLQDGLAAYERAARLEGHEVDGFVRQAQIEVERSRYARAVELLESSLVYHDTPRIRRYLAQVRRLEELTGRQE
jgi:tetratricopeptide (TPR) repeat protein